VREQMTPRVERLLMSGIKTQEATYKKAVRVVLSPNRHTVHITLSEGKKHEIRRMLNALNLTITSLKRTRILFLTLGTLKPGQTRELTEKDRLHLLAVLSSLTRQ
jgi:23S rRNA pseudouridine2605 synthase